MPDQTLSELKYEIRTGYVGLAMEVVLYSFGVKEVSFFLDSSELAEVWPRLRFRSCRVSDTMKMTKRKLVAQKMVKIQQNHFQPRPWERIS